MWVLCYVELCGEGKKKLVDLVIGILYYCQETYVCMAAGRGEGGTCVCFGLQWSAYAFEKRVYV